MKYICALLSALLLLSPADAQSDDPEALLRRGYFSDIPTDAWYAPAATWASQTHLLSPTAKAIFSPEQPITRLEFLAALWRLSGSPAPTYTIPFDDASPLEPDLPALLWGTEQGITTGLTATRFCPSTPITRQDAALMLYRLAGLPDAYACPAPTLTDWYAVFPWAAEATAWAVEQGILTGYPDGLLHPADPLTRAQAAALLQRFSLLSF